MLQQSIVCRWLLYCVVIAHNLSTADLISRTQTIAWPLAQTVVPFRKNANRSMRGHTVLKSYGIL